MNNFEGAYYKYVFREEVLLRPFVTYSGEYTQEYISGYVPRQILNAYGVNSQYTGKGIKIALIEAYDRPELTADTDVFCETFGLPKANISVYHVGNISRVSQSWEIETTLDVQWAHVAAPDAELYVVFAQSASVSDLLRAVDQAVDLGADIISMSFGIEEFSGQEKYYESLSREGICYVAASGDVCETVVFPSSFSNVVSVGGTELSVSRSGRRISRESLWENTGYGKSKFVEIPKYQSDFSPIKRFSDGFRTTPDLSFFASTSEGVAIYHTIARSSADGWSTAGGTSLGAPFVAGILARAAERDRSILARANEYLYNLAGKTRYARPQYFYNFVSGCPTFSREGWTLCSGLGSPVGKQIIEGEK